MHLRRERENDRVREYDLVAVQVVNDVLNVSLNLGSLIADEVARLVATNAGDISELKDFLGGEAKQIQGTRWALHHAQRPTLQHWCRFASHSFSPVSARNSLANRPCSQAAPELRSSRSRRVWVASGWRLRTGGASAPPGRVFSWAMRFPVGGAGAVVLEHPSNTARRIEIILLAVAWVVALWITRKPSRA